MNCVKQYTSIISTVCVVGVLLSAVSAGADGDPSEVRVAEVTQKTETTYETVNDLLPDEQGATTEEAVATVTADGDFLLPTYLLPGETATLERKTTVEEVYETPAPIEVTVETTGRGKAVPQPPQEVAVMPEPEVQSAPDTVVIASPDDEINMLLQETAPAQQPFQVEVQVVNLGEAYQKYAPAAPVVPAEPIVEKKKKLLIPLAPIPPVEMAEPALPTRERVIAPSEYADRMVNSLKTGEKMPFLMPHEIRITFYPKASSFSGQALKWVKAFALAAVQDPRLIVEVRASCAEADLQAARIKLVKEALKSAGLSTHQIVVNYTNRSVDTMLLRAVPRQEASEMVVTEKDKKLPKNMSRVQKW